MGMERTFAFLDDVFGAYYKANRLPPPPGFQQREYGFLFHGKTFFRRHQGYMSPDALWREMERRPPAHVYHSSAYYDRPGAPTMLEKGWVGADLVFDLDADHLEGADKMSYAEMLEAVKHKFLLLVDDFLIGEFGFRQQDVHLVFSGSRGYHAHVRDPSVHELGSPSRREIVDYITGKFDSDEFVSEKTVSVTTGRAMKSPSVPSVKSGGWKGKLARATVEQLQALADDPAEPEERAKAFAKETGVGLKEAKVFVEALSGSPESTGKRLAALADGNAGIYQGIGAGSYRKLFGYHLGQLRGWCDEPVSSDVKRLIRAPGSLHGKTGLKAVPLTRDEVDGFDPLVDAVALSEEPVSVNVSRPLKAELKGEAFDLKPGVQKLPQYAAVFTILRRHALLEGDTPPAPPPPKAAPQTPAGRTG